MKKLITVCLLFLYAFPALARTDCPAAKIQHIQIEGKKILYQQAGAPWRTLGYTDAMDGTKERYAALLAAQASGRIVMVAYSSNTYVCSEVNYGTSALLVRTYN